MKRDNTSPIEAIDTNNNSMTVKKDFEKRTSTEIKFSTLHKWNFLNRGKKFIEGTIFPMAKRFSGKTYTMVGEFDKRKQRNYSSKFWLYFSKNLKNNDENSIYTISFIQIYIENIQNLFELKNKIVIREDKENGVFFRLMSMDKS